MLADGGAPGATAFSAITGATNTTAAMIVGAGATLGWTSTGTINANGLGASLACANCGGSAEALTITSQAAADVPLKIVGAASQSGKLLEVTNSTPVDLDYIDSAGSWFVGPSNSSQIKTSPTLLAWIYNGGTRGTIACASGSGGDCDIISNTSNGNIILMPGGNGLIQLYGPSISKGTKFTISGCSAGSTLGGSDTGSFLSGTTGACTVVVTISGATGATATNGWVCYANDLTTPANLISQSAYSTTTCTITGTTVSGDLISFSARAF